jgi:hypothetical protein
MKIIFNILYYIAIVIIGLNLGKLLARGLFELVIWSGAYPYLEKFFNWIVL